MFEYKETRTMTYAVMVSLALHGGLLLPAIFLQDKAAPTNKTDKLLVEIYGMISNRQSEERAPSVVKLPPRKAVSAQNSPRAMQQVKKSKPLASESPVQTPQLEHQAVAPPIEAPIQQPTQALNESADASNPTEAQEKRTLDVPDKSADELKQYLTKVKKRLSANLIYPDDAKKGGYEGTPVVKFMISKSGDIQPGSLRIIQSSGHADLDANALKAARESEPFEQPSRDMEVAIAVSFGLKN